jgi:hypothetical protein
MTCLKKTVAAATKDLKGFQDCKELREFKAFQEYVSQEIVQVVEEQLAKDTQT